MKSDPASQGSPWRGRGWRWATPQSSRQGARCRGPLGTNRPGDAKVRATGPRAHRLQSAQVPRSFQRADVPRGPRQRGRVAGARAPPCADTLGSGTTGRIWASGSRPRRPLLARAPGATPRPTAGVCRVTPVTHEEDGAPRGSTKRVGRARSSHGGSNPQDGRGPARSHLHAFPTPLRSVRQHGAPRPQDTDPRPRDGDTLMRPARRQGPAASRLEPRGHGEGEATAAATRGRKRRDTPGSAGPRASVGRTTGRPGAGRPHSWGPATLRVGPAPARLLASQQPHVARAGAAEIRWSRSAARAAEGNRLQPSRRGSWGQKETRTC